MWGNELIAEKLRGVPVTMSCPYCGILPIFNKASRTLQYFCMFAHACLCEYAYVHVYVVMCMSMWSCVCLCSHVHVYAVMCMYMRTRDVYVVTCMSLGSRACLGRGYAHAHEHVNVLRGHP